MPESLAISSLRAAAEVEAESMEREMGEREKPQAPSKSGRWPSADVMISAGSETRIRQLLWFVLLTAVARGIRAETCCVVLAGL